MSWTSYRMQIAQALAEWLGDSSRPWAPQIVRVKPSFDNELEQATGTLCSVVLGPRWKGNQQRERSECNLTLFVVVQRRIQTADDYAKLREIDECMALIDQIEDTLLLAESRNWLAGEWLLEELDSDGDEREPFSDGFIRSMRQFSEAIPCRFKRLA